MARILRGEIRWADLNPVRGREQAGKRPVLILSHDVFNARSGTAIAMAITSQKQKAGFPLTLEVDSRALPKQSWVKSARSERCRSTESGSAWRVASPEQVEEAVESLNEIVGT